MDTEARLQTIEIRLDTIDAHLDKIDARLGKHDDMFVDVLARLVKIETRLGNMATKEDLAAMGTTLIKWMVGLIFGASVAAITVMTFVLNNAVPKAPVTPPAQPAPIVIQMPPYK